MRGSLLSLLSRLPLKSVTRKTFGMALLKAILKCCAANKPFINLFKSESFQLESPAAISKFALHAVKWPKLGGNSAPNQQKILLDLRTLRSRA